MSKSIMLYIKTLIHNSHFIRYFGKYVKYFIVIFSEKRLNKWGSQSALRSILKLVSQKTIFQRKRAAGRRYTLCCLNLPFYCTLPLPLPSPLFLNYSSKGISGRALSSVVMRQQAVLGNPCNERERDSGGVK